MCCRRAVRAPATGLGDSVVSSVSFSDAQHGLAIRGDQVDATTDRGRTWRRIASLEWCGACPGSGPWRVRMLTPRIAYALGPGTYRSIDGGHHWRRLPGVTIESVALGAGATYATRYRHGGCPAACTLFLTRAPAESAAFARVPTFRDPTRGDGDDLVAAGRNVYALAFGHPAGGARDEYSRLAISRNAGVSWSLHGDPCRIEGAAEVDALQVAAAGSYVAFLCQPRLGGRAAIAVSADAGRTFTRVHPPAAAAAGEIALDGDGDLAIANGVISGSGPFRYRLALSRDLGKTWRVVLRTTSEVS